MNRCDTTKLTALACAFTALALPVHAAGTAIFRCVQPDGRVLYTDVPCAGGAPIDLHPGTADPAAPERLARAQASLDAATAQRNADQAREAAQRAQYAQMQAVTSASAAAATPPLSDTAGYGFYGFGYGYAPDYGGGNVRPRPPRPRPPLPPREKKVVSAQPKNLPTIKIPGAPDAVRTPR